MNSASPNSQKTEYERMLCVARALMSSEPTGLEIALEVMRFQLSHLELLDKWLEVPHPSVGTEGRWYVFVSSAGWGKSQGRLPDGMQADATFEPRGEWSLRASFRQTVKNYLSGIAPWGEENRARIEHCIRMVKACDDTYDDEHIASFRRWLAEHGEHPIPSLPDVVVLLPQQLIDFSRNVATLRARFAANALLMGGVGTAADICMAVAGDKLDVFFRYTWYLTSGNSLHPIRILNGIVQRAIREGFVPTLAKIADNYRERVASKLEAAKAAPDIDSHLDCLYEAVPYAKGAHLIYSWLLRYASDTSDAERQRFRGAERDTDETLARLGMPFLNQVLDFGGHCWALHKRDIDRARRSGGERAAQGRARFYVDRILYYPESTLGILLEP